MSKILFDNYKQVVVVMSNQPTPSVFIEMAFNSNAFFQGSQKGDVCIRTAQPSQSILFGTQINQPAIFGIDGSNIIMRGNIAIGGQSSNPIEALDIRNGNAYFDSNVYVMNKLCIGGTNPDGALHVTNGDTKLNSNLYVIGTASIGISSSNPTETLDVNSNLKVRSNAYVMHRVGVANSNPTEALDITGNIKVTNNIYSMSNIGIGSSNPTERLDVQQNAMVRSNAYVLRRLAVGGSNPTEALDVSGNGKITGNMFVSSAVGIGNTNPTEALDVNVNLKVRSNAYITHRVGVGTSNPTETVDVIGNTKVSANIYALNAVGVGTTSPSEKVDIVGNAKVQSNMYVVNRIGVGVSNPTERVDVAGNVYASGSIYSMTNIGVGTVLPGERIEATGNIKSLSNVYVMNRVAVGHSNPTERMDVTGNVKVSSNIYIANRLGVNTTSPSVGLEVHTTDSILLPKGTTSQRPAPAVLGHVRYNTDTSQFEGFGAGSAWGSLGGVKSTNQQTFISAEEFPTSNDDNIRFINSNIETMRITREGNVGVATSNPEARLDVNGLFRFKDPNRENYIVFHSNDNWEGVQMKMSMTGNEVAFGVDPNNFETVGFVRTLGRMPLTFGPNNIERMRIDHSSGYVGINTTTPFYNLDVNGSVNASGYCNLLVDSTSSESTSNAPTANALKLAADAAFYTSNVLFLGSGGGSASVASVATSASNTAYWSSNNLVKKSGDTMTGTLIIPTLGINTSSASERLGVVGNIKASSNIYVMSRLGVNTSNPSQAVHVVGNMRLEGNLDVNGIFNTINTDVQVTDQFTVSNNGTGPALKVHQMGAQAIADFYDDSNIAMRIADGGSVGIGTTTPAYRLDVNGNAKVISSSTTTGLIVQTADVSTVIGNTVGTENFGSIQVMSGGSSSTIGSSPYRLNLQPNGGDIYTGVGNVGIGTKTPSYKLDVNGFTRSTGFINTSHSASFDTTLNGIRNIATFTGTLPFQCVFRVSIISTHGSGRTMCKNHIIAAHHNSTNNTWQRCLALNGGVTGTNGDYELQMNMTGSTVAFRVVHTSAPVTDTVTVNICCEYSQGNVPTVTDNTSDAQYTDVSLGTYVFHDSTQITQRFGNVGIGLSNPSFKLDVQGLARFGSNVGQGAANPLLQLQNGTSNLAFFANLPQGSFNACVATGDYAILAGINSINTGSLTLGNWGECNAGIRIDKTGHIGVGTNSPSYRLDVSGSVRASGELISTSNNALRAVSGNFGVIHRNDGTDYYHLLTNSGSPYGTWNSLRPFSINLAAGSVNMGNNILFVSHGTNVGINTTSPNATYRLDVNGNMNATTIFQNGATLASTYMSFQNAGILSNALTIQEATGSVGSASSGTLTLKHNNSGGTSSIVFTSTANAGSDYAYIRYTDHDISTYFTQQIGTNECSRLTIGVENDNTDVNVAETIVIKGGYGIAYDSSRHFFTGGNVGIGTNNPSQTLDVNGTVNATTYTGATITSLSNLGLFGSNTSVWSSNNLLNRNTGGTIIGLTTVRGTATPGSGLFSSMTFTNPSAGYGGLRIDHTSSYGTTNFLNASDDPVNVLTNGVSRFVIKKDSGFVGVNIANPTVNLHVDGEILATNDITAFSDITAKSNLQLITTPLDKVSKLNGYTYDMNQEKPSQSKVTPRYTGVVAQELEKVLPEAVHKDPNGKLSVAYGNMAGLFIECIKELTSQNKQLTQENQDLKSQLQALATKVADIEKVIPLSH